MFRPIVPGPTRVLSSFAAIAPAVLAISCSTRAGQHRSVRIEGATNASAPGVATSMPAPPDATPPDASVGPAVRAIGVGEHFSCALLESGDVRCWGASHLAGVTSPATPVSIGISDGVSLGVGPAHACVARRDGSVWCWGSNRDGNIGDGTTIDRTAPVRVPGVRDIVEVVSGACDSCARDTRGRVFCWGLSFCSGHGTSGAPGLVGPMPPATHLVAGEDVTCAFLSGAPPRCWGFNTTGLLGRELGPVTHPIPSEALAHATRLALGFRHACLVQGDDQPVYCGGDDMHGQLGDQDVPDDAMCNWRDREVTCTWQDRPPPEPVYPPGVPIPSYPPRPRPAPPTHTQVFPARQWFVPVNHHIRATALAAGNVRTCAVTSNHTVSCWGEMYFRSDWSHHRPTEIPGTQGAVDVAVSHEHACALMQDHSVRCWGYNRAGELGSIVPTGVMVAFPSAMPVRW